MRIPKHPTLIRRLRDARVRQFAARCPPLAASRRTSCLAFAARWSTGSSA